MDFLLEHEKQVQREVFFSTANLFNLEVDRQALSSKDRYQKVRETLEIKEIVVGKGNNTLSAEDVALGYKSLMEVKRAFRTLKRRLDLRPLYHRKPERIRAHVLLCCLVLLLVRIVERETGQRWDSVCSHLERLHLVEFSSKQGRVLQRTQMTAEQANILKKLKMKPPPLIYQVDLKA